MCLAEGIVQQLMTCLRNIPSDHPAIRKSDIILLRSYTLTYCFTVPPAHIPFPFSKLPLNGLHLCWKAAIMRLLSVMFTANGEEAPVRAQNKAAAYQIARSSDAGSETESASRPHSRWLSTSDSRRRTSHLQRSTIWLTSHEPLSGRDLRTASRGTERERNSHHHWDMRGC